MQRQFRESDPTPAEKKMINELNKRRVIELIETFYRGDIEGALSLCER